MKKAVIVSGGVQHLVAEGETITVNFLGDDVEKIDFVPIMIVDGANSIVDTSKLKSLKVSAKVVEQLQGDKVIALRYKAKKRVHTRRGHRQKLSKIEIESIK